MNRLNEQPDISGYARDFLASVVPWNYQGGYITIHWQYPGKKGFPGRSFKTIDAALQWVTELQTGPHANIYFCTSSQKLNNGHRDRENAIALQVVPVDIDVDPDDNKKYSNLPEAIAALLRCCIQLGIPRPSFIVASGGGLHAYWLSDRPLPVDEWQPFANALKTAFKNAGLKFDLGVTGDAARVLRVPGTNNWKKDKPRRVRLLQTSYKLCNGVRHDFAAVFGKLLSKTDVPLRSPSLELAEAFKGRELKNIAVGIVIDELPPLPLEPILAECAWLREAYETGGKALDEPQWNLTTLVAVFLENGHELAHKFGNQHDGYTFESTEKKFEEKQRAHKTDGVGWPLCKTISDNGGEPHCKSCPHFAAGKSPLNLALQQAPPPQPGAKLPLIVELGLKLWGAPTAVNGKEYRFGADQSKAVDPGKGAWFDFATSKGGYLKDLMKKVATVATREQPNADDVVVICAADVVMRPLDWLWEGHLLRGSQELMSGLPDLSKSTVQINYIACATARLQWPDGAPAIDPMNVVMLTAEDTLEQIVVPRLRAAGADVNRVSFLKCIKTDEHDRQFLLAEDLDRLECLVNKIGNVGLITIDPIIAYMGGRMDSHKATEVRAQLGPLKDFAERTNIAISTITHPPKSAGQRALDHFIGSQAFIAACRVGHLCIAEMEENETGERIPTGRILFTNVRNTAYRQRMPTLAYRKKEVDVERVGQGSELRSITAPQIVWEGPVEITADAAVAAASGKKSDQQPKAQAFLREVLKDSKPVPQKEIEEAAAKKGFTDKQLRTARERLGVHVNKEPGKMDGKWLWQLPDPSEGKYYY